MADHQLPEDPRDWPNDPFQVLGIAPPISEQDLKRAYIRLIRRFKPEHNPEEFRRIREAYETAQARLKWLGFFTVEESIPSPVVEPEPVSPRSEPEPASPPSESTTPETAPAAKAPQTIVSDPVEAAWKQAVSGQRSDAYAQLVDLDRTRSDSPKSALRLYWLLALHPELDQARTRHDWLAAGLIRSRLSGPITDLYERELEAWPEAALSGPYQRLLETDAAESSLLQVARQRLESSGSRRKWAAIDGDLLMMADRSAQFDESTWLSYLIGVMAHVCFDKPEPVYGRCVNLLSCLRHLELKQSWAFDRIEELQQMASEWRSAASAPAVVRDVVRDSWVSLNRWKKAMERAAAWATTDPVAALNQLHRASQDSECRSVLETFQQLLRECHRDRKTAYPPGLIRGLIREFLSNNGRDSYSALRPNLLHFLVREAIDPQELIDACSVDVALGPRALVEHVRFDPTLRMVWLMAHAV